MKVLTMNHLSGISLAWSAIVILLVLLPVEWQKSSMVDSVVWMLREYLDEELMGIMKL